ncbi:hypothetical protein [Flavobacterium terrae]|uniref:Uncharacterized protein n=1 Tax=Flavobacterium terrae TaxID=415425 RepID=A0A1M6G0I2_9FLAO|nr:hypothetical protein [Flavobacterium terrae]SHJ03352.1 hypothetical protein SAMN05444363_2443 [Flavobacterium terrae]
MATFEELGNKLEEFIKSISNFKIGKTGQSIEDRFNDKYYDDYAEYYVVGSAKESKVIDNFEKYLIDRFMNHENCDNEQIGGGEMTESDNYIVYVMYNK